MTEVSERVARGAALLDVKRPDWFMSVNPHVLDMAACDACVLGQLYGDYNVATNKLAIFGYEYGFNQDVLNGVSEYADLRTEWVSVINDRRARRYLKGE